MNEIIVCRECGVTLADGSEPDFEGHCPECYAEKAGLLQVDPAANARVRALFIEKLREQTPDHPWVRIWDERHRLRIVK